MSHVAGAACPLERIAEVRDEGDEIVVTTTGVHLAPWAGPCAMPGTAY